MITKKHIRTSARIVLLAALLTLSGFAIHKMTRQEACTENPQCKGCGQYSSCSSLQKHVSD